MKSILLHVYEDAGFEARLSGALDLARVCEGHITCLHATPFQHYLAVDPFFAATMPQEFTAQMITQGDELRERVEDRLRNAGASWDWVHCDERVSTALIRYSILSDVVIMTLGSSAVESDNPRSLPGVVGTGSRAPVLALPHDQRGLNLHAPALIAWNGSPESAAAARAALPLLRLASHVVLLEVEDKLSRYPRDLVARYLSRHAVHVDIVQRRPIEGRVSLTIMEAAAEAGAGLVVMGAYGHSRVREFLLGGVTRALIHNSPLPLLLAH